MRIRSIRLGVAPNCSSLGNVVNVLVWTQATVAVAWAAAESWAARRRRSEPDGGETIAVDEPPAIVRTEGPAGGDADLAGVPVEAHVQITQACGLPCPGCHVEPTVDGTHVPLGVLAERFRALAEEGVLHVALGGGEVARHPDLRGVITAAQEAGLSVGVTTSGVGLTPRDVAEAIQVNVSLDGVGDTFLLSRGYRGDRAALATIAALAAQGRVGVNLVLDRNTFATVEATIGEAVAAGARDIHLLRLKPVGRARADYLDRRLTPGQGVDLWPTVKRAMERWPEVTFRVDCALVPFLTVHGVDVTRMTAFDIRGCHGGDHFVSIGVDGSRNPCSFVKGDSVGWRQGVTSGACGECDYQRICRGGCHAVAGFSGPPLSPDPECPRVLAWNDAAAR